MAVIKAAKGGQNLAKGMAYVEKKAEITSGKDCSDDKTKALEEMRATKELHDQTEGRQYLHYIQSFKPGEVPTEKAHQLGQEWAENNFKGYEVYIGTHTDKGHVHNHFIINSVNHENGQKIQISPKDLECLKLENDRICQMEGLSVPQKEQNKKFRSYDQDKYKILYKAINDSRNTEKPDHEKVKSYVFDTAVAVVKVSGKARNQTEFSQLMEKQGYQTEWKENRKHITFTDPEGHKVRLANLEKTFNNEFFTKDGLEKKFAEVKQMQLERKQVQERQKIETQRQETVTTTEQLEKHVFNMAAYDMLLISQINRLSKLHDKMSQEADKYKAMLTTPEAARKTAELEYLKSKNLDPATLQKRAEEINDKRYDYNSDMKWLERNKPPVWKRAFDTEYKKRVENLEKRDQQITAAEQKLRQVNQKMQQELVSPECKSYIEKLIKELLERSKQAEPEYNRIQLERKELIQDQEALRQMRKEIESIKRSKDLTITIEGNYKNCRNVVSQADKIKKQLEQPEHQMALQKERIRGFGIGD